MLNRFRRDDAGYTLVELLVAIGILGIIGAITLTSVVRALQITTATTERTNALTDIERGLERVTRQIRTADPLRIDPDGACDSLTVAQCETTILQRRLDADTYADGQLSTYSYYLVDTGSSVELRQDITRTNLATNVVTPAATGSFIADVANIATGTPLFRFQTIDPVTGALVDIDCTGLTVNACRNAYATASVIEMTLSKVLSDATPLSTSTSVNIRNTRYQP